MAGDARFTISAEDRTKRGTASVKRNLKGVEKGAGSLTSSLGKMAIAYVSVATAMRAIGAASRFMKESIALAALQERAENKLAAARERLGGATALVVEKNQQFASALQQLTGTGDEAILEMQAMLLTIGGISEEQLPAATMATLDWAEAMSKDLSSAAMDVGKALGGNVMMLQRYGVEIDQLEVDTRGAAAVLEALNEKVGGSAQKAMETYTKKVEGLSGAWSDVKERIGTSVTESGTVLLSIGLLTTAFTNLGKAMDDGSMSDFFDELQDANKWGPFGFIKGLGMIDDAVNKLIKDNANRMRTASIQVKLAARIIEDTSGTISSGGDAEMEAALAEKGIFRRTKPTRGKGPSGPGIRASIALTQEEEIARATQAAAQMAIEKRIASQDRLSEALARTRGELADLNKEESARIAEMEEITRRQNDEATKMTSAALAEQTREAEIFAAQMETLMVSAGALAIQGFAAGMRGEADAMKQVFRGLISIAFQGIGLAIGGPAGGLIGGLGASAAGALLHDGGIIKAHNGMAPGLRPGEVPIIAQTGESVLTREATASIGSAGVQEINRRGGMPAGGMTINITAMDAKGVEESARRGPLGKALRAAGSRGRIGGPF